MEASEEVRRLLAEIRDAQREHLAEYRRVAERSMALQERAVARQDQLGRLYKAVLIAAGLLVLGLLFVLADLIGWI